MKDKDPSPDKYTPTEILEQVSLGNMSPLDAGLTGPVPIIGEEQPDPKNLRLLPQGPPNRVFSDKLEFQARIVPLSIRAEWEAQDAKIVPFDKETWIQQNKETYRIQAMLANGNGVLRLDQTYADPIDGFCAIIRDAADKLQTAWTERKAEEKAEKAAKVEQATKASRIIIP